MVFMRRMIHMADKDQIYGMLGVPEQGFLDLII
jgi:hypothetical protein